MIPGLTIYAVFRISIVRCKAKVRAKNYIGYMKYKEEWTIDEVKKDVPLFSSDSFCALFTFY